MVAMPAAATRNSGLELEAVVQATESAANQIMEAAEAIGDWLRVGSRDVASIEIVAAKLNSIFEACSFQDVTGQRIRRAIQHLQHVETMLAEVMPAQAEHTPDVERVKVNPDLVQDDVDRVFALAMRLGGAGAQGGSAALPEMAQDDVDQMFSSAPALPNGAADVPDLAQDAIDNMFAAPQAAPALPNGAAAAALVQNDIDSMFAAPHAAPVVPAEPAGKSELGQDDVDRMFG
jgi:chemotaxis regulatin CheY-phosphate phosphatase CheZ